MRNSQCQAAPTKSRRLGAGSAIMLATFCKATKWGGGKAFLPPSYFWGTGGAIIHLPHPSFIAPPSPKNADRIFRMQKKAADVAHKRNRQESKALLDRRPLDYKFYQTEYCLVRPMSASEERTVIISSRELVEHAVLSRKRNELSFKRDFLLRSGGKEGDLHLRAIGDELSSVEQKLAPIAEKLSVADMITLVPNRKEIEEYSARINQYARGELDLAIREKKGEAYELMKKRAALVKNNYERREDVARLTILLNTFPRKDAEAIRGMVEEGAGADADVSFIPKEKQQELVDLAFRLGRPCCVYAGSFSIDKKKADMAELKGGNEVERTITGGRKVWVAASNASEFDENEKRLASLLAAIQAKGAEKTARSLSDEESVNFDRSQGDYLEALNRRAKLVNGIELSESVKLYRKGSWKESVKEY